MRLVRPGPLLSGSEIAGSLEPRIWTPPLRELTPETSEGFETIEFAEQVLGLPLDPWQAWLVVHAGELLEDGRPRFKTVVVIVARQNGKTHVLVVLTLRWLFVDFVRLVLGTSTNLDYARESWEKAVGIVRANEALSCELPRRGGVRRANGEQTLTLYADEDPELRCRYKIAASNRRGGRSLTVGRLVLDELREHQSWEAWNAAVPATNAVIDAQTWAITNQGDDQSVVLNAKRDAALEYILTGVGDPRLGLFEWSAAEGSDPEDPAAIAAANPNLNAEHDHGIDLGPLIGDAQTAKLAGGEQLAGFKTEILCIRVPVLDPVIDAADYAACSDPQPWTEPRNRTALVLDVSLDQRHATLYAAAQMPDSRVRVDAVAAWTGDDCMRQVRGAIRDTVRRVRPQTFGWLPNGPAAAIAAELVENPTAKWPPRGMELVEIRRDLNAVCMGLAALVRSRELAHSDDPLLEAHLTGAGKLWVGDGWRYVRKGAGHVDAAYAAAGAVHLARTLPAPTGKPRLIVAELDSGV